ncbi:hypothetical protein DL764_009089 [Monosporascus ibericus]|uniref:N-acetyltransferase domain-containing protein n=1 Tax=Monosporascus ibericus TaxID=155417 RepID=A0A4V1X929_9PEZI|nr:hypothetical protein DL764_009089 [Monosporascus ibericus]
MIPVLDIPHNSPPGFAVREASLDPDGIGLGKHFPFEALPDKYSVVLESLGVDRDYQQKGLVFTLVDWGCRQADEQGLEVYLDATPRGLPFYKKHFGFENKVLQIPLRPETFGSYELMTVVRSPKVWSFSDIVDKQLSSHVGVEVVEVGEA